MTSTKDKGDKKERDVQAIIEAWGYKVCRTWRMYQRIGPNRIISRRNDFFNAFDLACKNEELTIWIQVTDTNNWKPHIPAILEVPMCPTDVFQIWAWSGGRRRLNKNYKDKKVWTKNQLYYVYTLIDKEFVLEYYVEPDGKILKDWDGS